MNHPSFRVAFCCSLLSMLGYTTSAQIVHPRGNYYISPNDSTVFWKRLLPEKAIRGLDQDRVISKKGPFVWGKPSSDDETQALASEAASIDPGILYNPKESRQPAGIVIIPQKEIDPHMIHEVPGVKRQNPGLTWQQPDAGRQIPKKVQ